jgi:hypothetical protein
MVSMIDRAGVNVVVDIAISAAVIEVPIAPSDAVPFVEYRVRKAIESNARAVGNMAVGLPVAGNRSPAIFEHTAESAVYLPQCENICRSMMRGFTGLR